MFKYYERFEEINNSVEMLCDTLYIIVILFGIILLVSA